MTTEPSKSAEDRQQALQRIVELANGFDIDSREIESALNQDRRRTDAPQSGSLLSKILGFFGGIFILSGIAVFIGLQWESMNSFERIIVTLGSGVAIFIMGLVAGSDPRFEKTRMPLFLVAALLQPTGMLVAINEFSTGGDWHYAILLTSGVMLVQQVIVFYRFRVTELLFTSLFFAAWFLAVFLDLFIPEEWNALLTGGCVVMFCAALEKYPYRVICPIYYFFGSFGFLFGFFEIVEDSIIELSFLFVVSAGIILSTYLKSRTLLFTNVVATFAFIGYFTNKYFLDSFGWPLVLILLGIVFVLLAALAVRLNRKYLSN